MKKSVLPNAAAGLFLDSMESILTLGTRNPGKLAEMAELLAGVPVEIRHLDAMITEVEETGATFTENAAAKASDYATQTRTYVLADDSGLEVAALGGRPGVLSARYGGVETSFREKMAILLHELEVASDGDRRARFVSALAFAAPDGTLLHTVEAICSGTIATEPRGDNGFGYDPLFVPEGFDRTFGELLEREKSKISHRGRAFEQIIPFLRDFFQKLT
jgi:XTP/dITP diphosphohydrolase